MLHDQGIAEVQTRVFPAKDYGETPCENRGEIGLKGVVHVDDKKKKKKKRQRKPSGHQDPAPAPAPALILARLEVSKAGNWGRKMTKGVCRSSWQRDPRAGRASRLKLYNIPFALPQIRYEIEGRRSDSS